MLARDLGPYFEVQNIVRGASGHAALAGAFGFVEAFVERCTAGVASAVDTYGELSNEVIAAVGRLVGIAFHNGDGYVGPACAVPKQFEASFPLQSCRCRTALSSRRLVPLPVVTTQ